MLNSEGCNYPGKEFRLHSTGKREASKTLRKAVCFIKVTLNAVWR